MLKALVPVDDSPASLRAVEHVIKLVKDREPMAIYLVNVQNPDTSWEIKSHLRQSEIDAMLESRGGDALAASRKLLDDAGIAYTPRVLLGPIAETLAAFVRDEGCDKVIMGTKGHTLVSEAIFGSVAHDLLRASPVPVTFVK